MTGLFYRRMFWLVLFGLIHAHLILWIGDILYLYGVCGMLVYLFRKVKPAYLVLGVPLVAILDFASGTLFYQHMRNERIAYVEASAVAAENKPLTEAQKSALAQWRELEKTLIPNREDAKENTRKMKSDYATVASHLRPLAWKGQTIFLPIEIWDSLALMLLGMALYQWGFLSGQWSNRDYAKVAAIGYGIGLPLATYSFYHSYLYSPNLEADLRRMELVPIEWVRLIYPFQRIALVMAHVAAIILLYKARYAQTLFRCLEAAGQMALSNYIMQSVICTLFFFGYGFNYYGELGVLPDLLRRLGHLDRAVDRQPDLAAVFPVRPARMGVAESDVLEIAAIHAAGVIERMTPLSEWGNFYVMVGSAAGALIGLQFVVMTLVANRLPIGAGGSLGIRDADNCPFQVRAGAVSGLMRSMAPVWRQAQLFGV